MSHVCLPGVGLILTAAWLRRRDKQQLPQRTGEKSHHFGLWGLKVGAFSSRASAPRPWGLLFQGEANRELF